MNHIFSYNNIDNFVGKSKIAKFFGWIFIIAGILICIMTVTDQISWRLKEKNYDKQYVYSDNGKLFYEVNNQKTYVEKIYNTSNENIELEIPNKKTVIMFCDKNNKNECIYIDLNQSKDAAILKPTMYIIISLITIGIGVFLASKKRTRFDESGKEKTSLNHFYIFLVGLFAMGLMAITSEISNVFNYIKLKNENNITTATIYSDIYTRNDNDDDYYKTVSYYYVDNKKYIYENNGFVSEEDEGPLVEKLGTTFELYYDKKDPNKVIEKDMPVSPVVIFAGIILIGLSAPFIFFKNKIEKNYDIISEDLDNIPWEI